MPTALYIVNLLPKSSRENQTLVKTNDTCKIYLILKAWFDITEQKQQKFHQIHERIFKA